MSDTRFKIDDNITKGTLLRCPSGRRHPIDFDDVLERITELAAKTPGGHGAGVLDKVLGIKPGWLTTDQSFVRAAWRLFLEVRDAKSDARFRVGEIVRYADGPTALMEISMVNNVGDHWRYYGEQYYGGSVGAPDMNCQAASDEEIAAWPTRWDCNEPGCDERVGGAGSGRCPTHTREDWHRKVALVSSVGDAHGAAERRRGRLLELGWTRHYVDVFLRGAEMAAQSTTAPNVDVIEAAVSNAVSKANAGEGHVVETDVKTTDGRPLGGDQSTYPDDNRENPNAFEVKVEGESSEQDIAEGRLRATITITPSSAERFRVVANRQRAHILADDLLGGSVTLHGPVPIDTIAALAQAVVEYRDECVAKHPDLLALRAQALEAAREVMAVKPLRLRTEKRGLVTDREVVLAQAVLDAWGR